MDDMRVESILKSFGQWEVRIVTREASFDDGGNFLKPSLGVGSWRRSGDQSGITVYANDADELRELGELLVQAADDLTTIEEN